MIYWGFYSITSDFQWLEQHLTFLGNSLLFGNMLFEKTNLTTDLSKQAEGTFNLMTLILDSVVSHWSRPVHKLDLTIPN